ncbi:MAG: TolB family protein, partial [Gemmatimonas sp.]|uniref:TolB family protein n=1 Tax=Gemmatimonas sp. TaxID=1962908 RepID=UPI00391DF5DB
MRVPSATAATLCFTLWQAGATLGAQAPTRAAAMMTPLTADQIQSVTSMIAGRDAPMWHPDGTRLAFLGSMGGPIGLWEVDRNGGLPRQLIPDLSLTGVGSTASQNPRWSPAGDAVAYVSSKGGAPEIWLWSAQS